MGREADFSTARPTVKLSVASVEMTVSRGVEKQTRTEQSNGLVLAVAAFDGVEEFCGVVADAVLEDDFDFFDVVDVGGGVAVDDD
jgi:hypothetical protein